MEPSSPPLMEPLGLQGLLEHHTVSLESPTPNNFPPSKTNTPQEDHQVIPPNIVIFLDYEKLDTEIFLEKVLF
jgi:hypothetical protein